MTLEESKQETKNHIALVRRVMTLFAHRLLHRAIDHDASKLESPEAEGFAEVTHILRGLTYGSEEYKACLERMKPFLKHHYEHNKHHPEHYEDGIDGMTLFDLVEMFCDWMAATQRHADGDIFKSIEHNETRFGISPQLVSILRNTAKDIPLPQEGP